MPLLSADDGGLLLDGKRFQLISGSICYFRILPEHWADRLGKLVALGANAVEVYVPWNFHERRLGEWDFSGPADLARFIRLAGNLGLLVLLRPGPYICAEWSMGGLPWWLLARDPPPKLRCGDPYFLEAVEAYFRRLSEEVAPLLCSEGGPIVAAQVENEYGYWGADAGYLRSLRDLLRETLGPELFVFTVDGCFTPETQQIGGVEGALRTASFGSSAGTRFQALRAVQPTGPLVCMEFWVGWFSTWGGGAKMERSASTVASELQQMLAMGASVNIFVFAGGTSFGFWAGANLDAASGRLEPHVTSYDYDGLLTEGGALTEKFFACQRVIAAHTGKVPQLTSSIVARPPTLRPRAVTLHQHATLLDSLPAVAACAQSAVGPLPMEALGEGLGYMLYRFEGTGDAPAAVLHSLAGLPLKLHGVRDFALVLCDGQPLGTWDRSAPEPDLQLPQSVQCLDVIVEVTARVNFGPSMAERKGLDGRVTAGIRAQDERELFGWRSFALPMRAEQLARLEWHDSPRTGADGLAPGGPCFYRGLFELSQEEAGLADSWLRVPGFSRGFVALNGFNLGWHRREGPQLSLFVPASLLLPGQNEVVVFEFLAPALSGSAPCALLEAGPVWSRDRKQLLACQAREVWGFARQVGCRRLLRLAAAEIGPRTLMLALGALAAVLVAAAAGLAARYGARA